MTNKEKYKCALREYNMRVRVYPRWIKDGRMTAEKAAYEIAVMGAIVEDYHTLAMPEELPFSRET